MLAPSQFAELAPLTRWARELNMPDPLALIETEWALAETDAVRDEAMRTWGAAGHPTPVLTEINQTTDWLTERFDGLANRWVGEGHEAFSVSLTSLVAATREEVAACQAIGEAMVAAADRIETAYLDAVAVCADACTRISAITADAPEGDPTTRRRVAELIDKTLGTLVESCREVRGNFAEDLIPTVRAITDQPNPVLDPPHQHTDQPGGGTLAVRGDQPQLHPVGGTTHVVVAGDTLWDLAVRYLGDGTRWPEIHAANHDLINDPDLIYPGQQLHIPSPGTSDAPPHVDSLAPVPPHPGSPTGGDADQPPGTPPTPTPPDAPPPDQPPPPETGRVGQAMAQHTPPEPTSNELAADTPSGA
ncbi:MAG: LysM peptidoglycan-binding domain-containing protein, partial [Natronosporangium sp.]